MENSLNSKSPALKVFLVDDDRDDQKIFIEALSQMDRAVQLSIYDSGQELLRDLKNNRKKPDVIFLDLYMPVMNGEECLKKLRRKTYLRDLPVVVYSSEFHINRIEHLFEVGATKYLRKPDSFYSLVAAIKATMDSISRNAIGGNTLINIVT